jgi:urease subunit gamma/beta
MRLTSWEEERLLIFAAAELGRRHRAAGLALNHPETVAIICDAMLEAARAGATLDQIEIAGRAAVRPEEVMAGVPALVDEVRLEVLVGDGTRLIVLLDPLGRAGSSADPGAVVAGVAATPDRAPGEVLTLEVTNTSTRVVRVSSHFPFDRVNARLQFDRAAARGRRLDLPAGGNVRWAPGETREVRLVPYRGSTAAGSG